MREITGRQAIAEALIEEMNRDDSVFLMGEDIGVYGGSFNVTKGFMEKFGPRRIRETPISEAAITGAAIGAAMTGTRPVAEIMYMDFLTIASDQLVNQGAKMRFMFGGQTSVPLVLRTPAGADQAGAHHSQSLEAWFYHIPGLKMVMPSTPYDLKGLLKTAIRDNNPVLFIEHKHIYDRPGQVPDSEYTIPLGQADIKRTGGDVTIIATANMVFKALEAAHILEEQGIEAEVIDPRTLMPLDIETMIDSAVKTGRVVIAHEAHKRGGIGGDLAARIVDSRAFAHLKAPIKRVAGLDIPVPFSPVLEEEYKPGTEEILEAVREISPASRSQETESRAALRQVR